MTEDYVVDNYPIIDSEECRKITEIRDQIRKGVDMLMIKKDEKQERRDEYQDEKNNQIDELSQEEHNQPRYTKNIEAVYYLTEIIQTEINNVLAPKFNGKIRYDNTIRANIEKFYDENIELYTSQLIVYIESLITIDGFNPSMFHGYKHLEMMIHESVGNIKMNYLLALMNIVRQIIPPDITTTPVHVIEPTIPKNSNPRDA